MVPIRLISFWTPHHWPILFQHLISECYWVDAHHCRLQDRQDSSIAGLPFSLLPSLFLSSSSLSPASIPGHVNSFPESPSGIVAEREKTIESGDKGGTDQHHHQKGASQIRQGLGDCPEQTRQHSAANNTYIHASRRPSAATNDAQRSKRRQHACRSRERDNDGGTLFLLLAFLEQYHARTHANRQTTNLDLI